MSDRPLLTLAPDNVLWMVLRADTGRIRRRHPTEESAIAEARRLAALAPDKDFIVLKSVRRFGRKPT